MLLLVHRQRGGGAEDGRDGEPSDLAALRIATFQGACDGDIHEPSRAPIHLFSSSGGGVGEDVHDGVERRVSVETCGPRGGVIGTGPATGQPLSRGVAVVLVPQKVTRVTMPGYFRTAWKVFGVEIGLGLGDIGGEGVGDRGSFRFSGWR